MRLVSIALDTNNLLTEYRHDKNVKQQKLN